MDKAAGQKRTVQSLYPPIEPFDQRVLPVGDGHHVYLEQCGRVDGAPIIVFHGGPGRPGSRREPVPARLISRSSFIYIYIYISHDAILLRLLKQFFFLARATPVSYLVK